MNSYERVMARLRGEPVDRPPNFNIMMQFAAQESDSRFPLTIRIIVCFAQPTLL